MRTLINALAGLIFGLGLLISGMANPAKVQNFLDLAGTFDPSLIFVMVGAIAVTFLGYRFAFQLVLLGLIIPLTPLGPVLGFVEPPPGFYLFLVVAVAAYLLLVEVAKRFLYRHVRARPMSAHGT